MVGVGYDGCEIPQCGLKKMWLKFNFGSWVKLGEVQQGLLYVRWVWTAIYPFGGKPPKARETLLWTDRPANDRRGIKIQPQ
jgi:hypothetical protein